MEDEPQGHNFDPSFKAKDPNEIRLRLLLWDEEQRCRSGGCAAREAGTGMLSHPFAPISPRSCGTLGHLPWAQVGSEGAGGRGVHKARGLGTECTDRRMWGRSQDQTASRGNDPQCWLCPDGVAFPQPAFASAECLRVCTHR